MSVEIRIPDSFKEMMDKDSPFYSGSMENGANNVRNLLQRHYRKKGLEEPNRLGGRRTNFWADIARSVQGPLLRLQDWVVSITDPRIWQKIKGGKITAKRVQALTIPIHKDAHGVRAAVLQAEKGIRLFKIKTKSGDAVLAGEQNGVVTAYYLLKKSVDQDPWPGSIPEEFEIMNAFHAGMREYIHFRQAS